MLQHGAAHVIAIDTGYGQIDARFRGHPQVELLERTNARYLSSEQLSRSINFVAMDVSFISATLVLPAVVSAVRAKAKAAQGQSEFEAIVLVKPQFEVGRELVGKGGIVRDETAQLGAVAKVKRAVAELGGKRMEWIESPILGGEGNREFLLHFLFAAE
jgi:23S rRNA (cytidine1920-2'-O)/16S rRNA (cytidine1409-2'-O)-methyltransferase